MSGKLTNKPLARGMVEASRCAAAQELAMQRRSTLLGTPQLKHACQPHLEWILSSTMCFSRW